MPDFRNLGVILRVAMLAEGLRFLLDYLGATDVVVASERVVMQAYYFEPALMTMVLVLFAVGPTLIALPYRQGVAVVFLLALCDAFVWNLFVGAVVPDAGMVDYRYVAVATIALTLTLVFYFNWRHRVLSPALSEARLMALQARIRPHFLFNSLNTVLGLIRTEPRRAETVLENLAELFRALMSESSVMVPLAKELELVKAYAEVESVRLGNRLQVVWQCQSAPMDALVPPLMLQPLVENAVYHGIEPAEAGGTITVTAFPKDEQLHLVVRNPYRPGQRRHAGNRMALDNIRERLELHFDAEASMRAYESGDEFIVQIRMPYRHG